MKICLVGGGLKGGGQERTLTDLANYFNNKGHKIQIINLFKTEQFYYLNPDIVVVWPKHKRVKNNRFIYALKIFYYLRGNVRKFSPDVIISFGEWFNRFCILSTRFLRVPVYLYDLMGPSMKLDPVIQFSRKALYRFANGIIVQTTKAGEIVENLTKARRIRVIPNPLNPLTISKDIKIKRITSLGRL